MINKKISIIALVAIVAVASTFYGMSELNPRIIVSSHSQFIDLSFEENVKQHDLVVVGEVVKTGVRVFSEDIMDIDENGKEYVFEHNEIPKAEITIKILETLKDSTEKQFTTVTFYDDVNEAIGESDSQKARYISQYALDYQVGDQAIFALQYEDDIFKTLGYVSVYEISEDKSGKQTITTELDKLLGKSSIEFNQAKNTAKEVAGIQ